METPNVFVADAAETSAAHRGLLVGQHRASIRSTLGSPLDDYGCLVCWDKHNSGFFLLPW